MYEKILDHTILLFHALLRIVCPSICKDNIQTNYISELSKNFWNFEPLNLTEVFAKSKSMKGISSSYFVQCSNFWKSMRKQILKPLRILTKTCETPSWSTLFQFLHTNNIYGTLTIFCMIRLIWIYYLPCALFYENCHIF